MSWWYLFPIREELWYVSGIDIHLIPGISSGLEGLTWLPSIAWMTGSSWQRNSVNWYHFIEKSPLAVQLCQISTAYQYVLWKCGINDITLLADNSSFADLFILPKCPNLFCFRPDISDYLHRENRIDALSEIGTLLEDSFVWFSRGVLPNLWNTLSDVESDSAIQAIN